MSHEQIPEDRKKNPNEKQKGHSFQLNGQCMRLDLLFTTASHTDSHEGRKKRQKPKYATKLVQKDLNVEMNPKQVKSFHNNVEYVETYTWRSMNFDN